MDVSVSGFGIGFLHRGKLDGLCRTGLYARHAIDAVGVIVDRPFVFYTDTASGADAAAGPASHTLFIDLVKGKGVHGAGLFPVMDIAIIKI